MKPRIETLSEKKLTGKRKIMSFAENETFELWKSFMPQKKEILNVIGSDLYSVEVYPPLFFDNFNPAVEFEKWAAIEVTDFQSIPIEMETIILPPGLYAVFIHKGPASSGPKTYQYIFRTWLPGSDFILDNRPHFAVMGPKYKNNDPDSEEEIWIPVRLKEETGSHGNHITVK
jgi:AraC family transcriptional regulator